MIYPTIIEKNTSNLLALDPFSKLLQNRIVFIDDVTPELANSVIAQLYYLDSISQEEIRVYINSPGGCLLSSLAIYDVILSLKSPVKTVAIGCAASGGLLILIAGEKRTCLPNTRMMFHELAGGSIGKISEMLDYVDEAKVLHQKMKDIFSTKTLIKTEDHKYRDFWFGKEEALALKVLTE